MTEQLKRPSKQTQMKSQTGFKIHFDGGCLEFSPKQLFSNKMVEADRKPIETRKFTSYDADVVTICVQCYYVIKPPIIMFAADLVRNGFASVINKAIGLKQITYQTRIPRFLYQKIHRSQLIWVIRLYSL